LPSTFRLDQNYPNPFNPSTHIAFEMPCSADVTVTIHNLLGQLVATAVNGRMEAGRHVISFDASHLATGVYLYRLSAGTFVDARKMLLLR
jgi:hypothetical protein